MSYQLIKVEPSIKSYVAFGELAERANLCELFVRLVGIDGKPVSGREILVTPFIGDPVSGVNLTMVTDINGYASVKVKRGISVEVSFVGTAFLRILTVPNAAMADLLQVASIQGLDVYSIVRVANPIALPRTS